MTFTYATEDGLLLLTMLEESRYDVVVGNPPYVTVKDKALNQIYRSKFANVCKGTYAMTVPFMAQFFSLAKRGERAGWVGQITSNSFMKREFGTKLIEDFLIQQDLRLVADTSGAYIPGHGTPTVIIVGCHKPPLGPTVRAVLGVRGEPRRPDNPAKGSVWTSIVEHIDEAGWDDGWVTVTDLDRRLLITHPWSLTGGGAVALLAAITGTGRARLNDRATRVGFFADSHADEAFFLDRRFVDLLGAPSAQARAAVRGDGVRDWALAAREKALFPYDPQHNLVPLSALGSIVGRYLWSFRAFLGGRSTFGGSDYARDGRSWYEWHQLPKDPNANNKLTIAFAEVATHNHFVLDRDGTVFNRTAPVVRLPDVATEDEHLALLGLLNSSTACFWLKQVCHDKGLRGEGGGFTPSDWERFYQYNGSNVQDFPLPSALPLARGRALDLLAQELSSHAPSAILARQIPTTACISVAHSKSDEIRARMVAIQEELDWETYRLYGLTDEDLTYSQENLPDLALGERAFEIILARAVQAGDEEPMWFTRHNSKPTSYVPGHWPAAYHELVQRRLDLIASNPFIRLLERPEYKRRWAQEPWEKRQERAVRGWLLDRIEARKFWCDAQGRPLPRSVAQLADEVSRDADLVSVLALWEGRPDVPVTQSLVRLLADEAVPFLAAYRYKDSGLRKREAWEETWRLQRREDAGETVGSIAVPPKYTSADFRKNSYWQARGKLDVPKERFILYPDAGRETDPTPLLGWAGWDHAQQSLALSLIIGEREKDGWDDDRLIALVAGLAELQPWVDQWHGEVDASYGVSLAAFCREQLTVRAAQVGKTLEELTAWRPAPATRGRRARRPE